MKKGVTSPPGRRLELLSEAARLLSSSLELDVVLERLVAMISKTIKVEIVSIMLREDREDRFVLKASKGLPRTVAKRTSVPVGEGIAGWVAKSGEPLLIKDLRKDKRFPESLYSIQYSTSSLICLPLKREGKVVGILSVNNKKSGKPFHEEDLNWLSVIAEQASMALNNALLHHRVSIERDRIALINQLATSLMTTLKPGPLTRKILSSVRLLLGASGASLLLYDPGEDVLRFADAVGPKIGVLRKLTVKPGQGVAGWVLTHGQSALVRDAQEDRRFWPHVDFLTGLTTNSLIAVPLFSRGRVIGVLEVINRRDGGAFSESSQHFTEMIAAVASLALDNSFLYRRVVDFNRRLESMVKKRTGELVTANRRLRAILREKETLKRFNEEIINNLASGLVTFDEEGSITSITPPAMKILGLKEPFQRMSLHHAFGEVFARSLLEDIRAGRVPKIRDEVRLTLLGGDQKILGYTLSRMKNPPKGYDQWILLFHDLTEVKKAEEDLLRLDRLVSLGEVSAHVAHELRNPLTAMYSTMQYLSKKVSLEHRELTSIILNNMERMESTIRRMISLSRETPIEKRRIDLRELVSQSLFFLDKTFREGKIEVSTRLPASSLWIEGDPAQFQQALFNILINAVQAMEGGGRLKVSLAVEKRGGRKIISLVVADSGPGLPPSLIDRIFEPFFTTKESGTGLGLSIASRIIRSHEGRIRASNRPGGGVAFHITLPLPEEGGKKKWPSP